MNDHIPLYVPEPYYSDMLGHLASLITEARAKSPAPAETRAAAPASDRVWSDEEWQNAWPVMTDRSQAFMVELAKHQNEWVQIAALEDSLGSFGAVQGALSSLTKRMKKHGGPATWPFDVETDAETGRAKYRMAGEIATIVLGLARAT